MFLEWTATKSHICVTSLCWYEDFIMAKLFALKMLITVKTNYIYTPTDFS